jgi:hypothetical protein
MIFVMKFQAAAMSRANIPESERKDFSLYVDEFQNFSTESFATIMSEARKYHLNLIVANQFTTQLTTEIRDAVFGNMGTIVSFRIGQNDVESIVKYFQPVFESEDLLRVPNYNTIIRTLVGGVPTQPFSMATLPPLGNPNPKLAGALKQLSAAKYGKGRAIVEKDIFARMATKEPAPSFNRPTGPSGGLSAPKGPWDNPYAGKPSSPSDARASVPAKPAAPSAGSSFLDEWLHKKNQLPKTPPAPRPASPPAPSAGGAHYSSTPTVVVPERRDAGSPEDALKASEKELNAKHTTKNISSSETERNEVDKIAEELKQSLKPAATDVAKTDNLPTPNLKKPLQAKSDDDPDDTIYIDQDGNLHVRSKD